MRKRQHPVIENLEIVSQASLGKGVARLDDMVVFVEGAIAGDIVDVQVTKKKKSFMEARPLRVVKPSERRTEPFCIHFGVCGGCKWQHLKYSEQLTAKEEEVRELFKRLGKFSFPELLPIVGSKEERFYRNKMDYAFSSKRWLTPQELNTEIPISEPALGFHVGGFFDKVINVYQCHLQPSPSNDIRNFIRDYALQRHLSFYDIRNHNGYLRNLVIRNNLQGNFMVILIVAEEREETNELLAAVGDAFPQITSLQYAVNQKKNDSIHDLDIKLFSGADHIVEEMEGLKFKISPKSFFQTNPSQALQLYQITRDFAGLSGNEITYDLYTGTGSIALFVASKATKVVGLEYVEPAVEDARENAQLNGVSNVEFFAGDMKKIFTSDLFSSQGKPDVIITDPPRAGMDAPVVERINESGAGKVVYVSCNPATQARDIALMDAFYSVEKIQPVDMFPHTYHVENVVLLNKR